jgi:hypothetical protein
MRKNEEMGWLIPAFAVLLPVAILLIGWVMNILGLSTGQKFSNLSKSNLLSDARQVA